ncbi:MAG: transposase [Actinomycetota bacterium]|nr:transposase [Actinomycetota bacterium]
MPPGLEKLLDEVAGDNDFQSVAREVMPDFVHIFVRVDSTGSPADVAATSTGRTSTVLRAELARLRCRQVLWSTSYVAAPVGYVSQQTVRRYVGRPWDALA